MKDDPSSSVISHEAMDLLVAQTSDPISISDHVALDFTLGGPVSGTLTVGLLYVSLFCYFGRLSLPIGKELYEFHLDMASSLLY